MTDLFGNPVLGLLPGFNRRKRSTGYPAPPGTGPAGLTCADCEHYCRVGGHTKIYRKCAQMRGCWTNGPGTDIKASSAACSRFQPAQ